MSVYIILAVSIALIAFYIARTESKKREFKAAEQEGIEVFGVKIPTQDYFSLCNTCIAYLLCSPTKKVDMKLFISKEHFDGTSWRDSMLMIQETVNKYPIVQCVWNGDTTFSVDESGTLKKIEEYQKHTRSDDYIIPLFDIGLIGRNPDLFSASTKYQQAKTAENVLGTTIVSHFADPNTSYVKDSLADMAEPDYVAHVVHSGPRHISTISTLESMVVQRQ